MEKILVSIIVPVYNSKKYIDRCIKSLINQSYNNIEILLIDDGSTDNSIDIIKEYEKEDKRIKVIRKKNGGASSARNYGLDKCTGEYILFVDADDYVSFNMVEIMVKELDKKNSTIVFSNNDEIYKDRVEHRRLFNNINGDLNKHIVMREIASGKAGLICCKLIPKSVIDKFNIRFDENIKMSEDQLFFLEISQHVDNYVYLDECVYFYDRTNEESITSYYEKDIYINQIYVINRIEEIFNANKLDSLDDNKALAKKIKDVLIFCVSNESISINSKSIYNRIKNIKDILIKMDIDPKYMEYICDSHLGNLIGKGINSKNITLVSLQLLISFRILIPLKARIRNRMRKNNE